MHFPCIRLRPLLALFSYFPHVSRTFLSGAARIPAAFSRKNIKRRLLGTKPLYSQKIHNADNTVSVANVFVWIRRVWDTTSCASTTNFRISIPLFPLLFHSAFGPFSAILPRFFRVHCVSVLRLICILPRSSRISPAFYPFFNFPETFETLEIPKKKNVAAERDEFPRALYSMPPTGGILASQSESKK